MQPRQSQELLNDKSPPILDRPNKPRKNDCKILEGMNGRETSGDRAHLGEAARTRVTKLPAIARPLELAAAAMQRSVGREGNRRKENRLYEEYPARSGRREREGVVW
jgi:hypothetical protein